MTESLRNNGIQACMTILVFCVLLFGVTAATMAKPPEEFSEVENRVLRQKPQMKIQTVQNGDFEADYEEYLTDQFILRDQWVGLKTSVERLLLKRESKDIYFAEDGYLIEKHTGLFSTYMAQRNAQVLAQFADGYARMLGPGHMTVVIVPNAVDILEDKLPPFAPPSEEGAYLEQIASELPEDVWFDAESVLRERAEEELYYKTDHHWKTLAAFYVYEAWARRQGYMVPELSDYEIKTVTDTFEGTIQAKLGIRTEGDTIQLFLPKREPSYTVTWEDGSKTDTLYDYDTLDTRDQYAVYFGGNQSLIHIETDAGTGRKLLVIKDSYANCLIPFMLEEFDAIDVLDLRYTNIGPAELMEERGYTDLLVLYNASGFAEDMSITKLMNGLPESILSDMNAERSKR